MDDIPAGVLAELGRALPWVAFAAIVALIIGVLSVGTFVYSIITGPPEGSEVGLGTLILIYGPMMIAYAVLSLVTARYARAIAALTRNETAAALNHTLRLHTVVWRAFGLVIITFVVLGVVLPVLF